MSTSITLTSRRDNLTIGRWYWPSVGYELTFSQATLLNMLPQDVALLRSALSDGKLSSSAPLDAFLSGQVTASPLPATTTRASVDDSVGREVRAVVDDNDNISLVALGYGPIDVTPKDIQVTVINDLTTGGSLLPLSAEQGKILNDSKYTKPSGGIPASDLSNAVKVTLDKANTALQVAPVASVAGKTGVVSLTKSDVGLSDVDNTRDSAKPVSTLQAAAISQAKAEAIAGAPVRSVASKTGDITLVKSDVGLSNVDNTSDSNKPVSSAQAAAIAQAKSEAISGAPVQSVAGKTGNVALSKTDVGLSNVDNTKDQDKPVSAAQATAIAQAAASSGRPKVYMVSGTPTYVQLSSIGLASSPFNIEVIPDPTDALVAIRVDISFDEGVTYSNIDTFLKYSTLRWETVGSEQPPTHIMAYRIAGTSTSSQLILGV